MTHELEKDAEEVGIERWEVERLPREPLPRGDIAGPCVVHRGVEDETLEENTLPGVQGEVDRPKQGRDQKHRGQRGRNGPDRRQRAACGLAFQGPTIYCLLLVLGAVHGESGMRISQFGRRIMTCVALTAACALNTGARPAAARSTS